MVFRPHPLILLGLGGLFISALLFLSLRPVAPSVATLPLPNLQQLQHGDLIFRRGSGFISATAVRLSLQEQRYSHVGLLVVENGERRVVHALQDDRIGANGVVSQSLERYLGENGVSDWGVYRLLADPQVRRSVVEQASALVGDRLITFDDQFELDSDAQLYCSELIWKLLQPHGLGQSEDSLPMLAGKLYVPIDSLYLQTAVERIETLN